MKTALFLSFFILGMIVSENFAEIIPYSYSSGRDVAAVERRFAAFHAAKNRNASGDELNEICGPVSATQGTCSKVGKASDAAIQFCDTFCCLNGNKVGHCGPSKLDITPNWTGLLGALTGNFVEGALAALNPDLVVGCSCSDDWRDVKCGRDGSFLNIRCPIDNSACWRKCCRDGRNGGKCGGFLNTKCNCY